MEVMSMAMLLLALGVGALPLVGWLLWRFNDVWYSMGWRGDRGLRLPPGNMGLPFFGDTLSFLWYFKIVRRPEDFIASKRRRYGNGVGMYRTHLFGSPSILAFSPSIIKFIYQSSDVFQLQWPNVEIVGPNSLVAVQGNAHTRIRSFVVNAINRPDALRRIILRVQPQVISSLQSWASKGEIRAFKEVKKLMLENIGMLFASFKPSPLLETIDQLFAGLLRGVRALPINFPGTAYHHSLQCRKKLIDIFMVELGKRRANQACNKTTADDLLDGLMLIKDEDGKQLTDDEILDNIINLLIAGYNTTSLALMWAIYYLAKFPDTLQKLREENQAASQKKNGEFLTADDVMNMKYTNKVVEESVRLGNAVTFLFRSPIKDVKYEGYTIPKGWKVLLCLRYLHLNPENFDDPLHFNPERWNGSVRSDRFRGFGGGPRLCAGNMLARMLMAVVLHHLAIGYKWELLNPDAEIMYLPHSKPVDDAALVFSRL